MGGCESPIKKVEGWERKKLADDGMKFPIFSLDSHKLTIVN